MEGMEITQWTSIFFALVLIVPSGSLSNIIGQGWGFCLGLPDTQRATVRSAPKEKIIPCPTLPGTSTLLQLFIFSNSRNIYWDNYMNPLWVLAHLINPSSRGLISPWDCYHSLQSLTLPPIPPLFSFCVTTFLQQSPMFSTLPQQCFPKHRK